MKLPIATASLVALSLLGQPMAAALCAVECHRGDAARARVPSEHNHCASEGTRNAASTALTSGVAFCNHAVATAATAVEREQLVRPAQVESSLLIASGQPRASVHVGGGIHTQGPPGILAAPLPLRI